MKYENIHAVKQPQQIASAMNPLLETRKLNPIPFDFTYSALLTIRFPVS